MLTVSSPLRWRVATLLFLATLINYLDRQALSLLAPLLRDRYHFSNTDYSRIVFAFLLAYTIMQAGSGRLMDRLGTRRGFSLTIAFWSAAAMLHAAASSVVGFAVARFLLGFGEAGNWPGAVKVIAEWFPARQRGAAVGFFNSGSIVGALIAPLCVPWLALTFGWRAAFLATGVVGFLWLIPWLRFYRSPEEHPRISPEELALIHADAGPAPRPPAPWRALFRHRAVWALLLGRMLADPVWWFYVFWLPEYLKRERGFSMEWIAATAWVPFLTAFIGSFAGGIASGRLMRRGWTGVGARKAVMGFCALGMLAGIPAVAVNSAALSIALVCTVTFSYSTWATNILALPADVFPNEIVASVAGIAGTGAAAGGMLFTLATGFAVDHFSYAPVFLAAGLMPLASFLILALGIPRPAPAAASI